MVVEREQVPAARCPLAGLRSRCVAYIVPCVPQNSPIRFDFCFEIRAPRLRELAQDHAHMAEKHSWACPGIWDLPCAVGEVRVQGTSCLPRWLPLQSSSQQPRLEPGAFIALPQERVAEPQPSAFRAGLKASDLGAPGTPGLTPPPGLVFSRVVALA